MSKPVVLIAEELSPATLDALGPDFEVRHVDGADRSALLPAIADVTWSPGHQDRRRGPGSSQEPEGRRARCGVGLDNVDVPAATKAGVMVVNAPTSPTSPPLPSSPSACCSPARATSHRPTKP